MKLSKPFIIANTAILICFLFLAVYFYFQLQPKQLGGYIEGTEQYNGYLYARDNRLKSLDQCDDDKDDPEMNINKAFLEGCKGFFKNATN